MTTANVALEMAEWTAESWKELRHALDNRAEKDDLVTVRVDGRVTRMRVIEIQRIPGPDAIAHCGVCLTGVVRDGKCQNCGDLNGN